jgi:DNA repair exonuclease SbcCD nuclease subunit
MKFLHTADWQIGMNATQVGKTGEKVREERLAAAKRVIEVARQSNVSFLLIAGDTFEDNGVDRILVQRIADILDTFNGPVYVIPGNHDPLMPGSVWEHPSWRSSKRVIILHEEKPIEVPGGMLFPCPVREKYSRSDPTGWIHPDKTRVIKIGLAHGTVEGIAQEEPDYPIPLDAASKAGLDYLALGHWHSTTLYKSPEGICRMAYSGTHETTKFGERDSGNVLVIEITGPGAPPVIKTVKTGRLAWTMVEDELRGQEDLSKTRERIESLGEAATTLLDIRITGLLSAIDFAELPCIEEIVASRFLFGRVDISHLQPSPQDDRWVDELAPGAVRETARKLRELADPGYSGPRLPDATAEVAASALLELYALCKEKSR